VNFDPPSRAGLFELIWDSGVSMGFVNRGTFVLSAESWTSDPLRSGRFVADAPDTSVAYSATVTSTGVVPEPSTLLLLMAGLSKSQADCKLEALCPAS
jgi:hypothetical protein